MAVINDKCICGQEVIVRTKPDAAYTGRKDGKQVIYPGELTHENKGTQYNICRCKKCLEPIHLTCKSAAME